MAVQHIVDPLCRRVSGDAGAAAQHSFAGIACCTFEKADGPAGAGSVNGIPEQVPAEVVLVEGKQRGKERL
jgi:hypothetical protein